MQKLCTCALVMIFGGILLVGCGKSSSSTTNTVRTETGTAVTGNVNEKPLTAKQQVESCLSHVRNLRSVSPETKAKLERSCTHAGGSTSAQRKVVHEACEAIASQLPGAERARALRICRTAP
jgi:hypothetical protein